MMIFKTMIKSQIKFLFQRIQYISDYRNLPLLDQNPIEKIKMLNLKNTMMQEYSIKDKGDLEDPESKFKKAVEDYVIQITKDYFRTTQKNKLNLESNLKDHGLDSLDCIELIIQVEDDLGYVIDAEKLSQFTKPKHFVNYILQIEAYKREFHYLPEECFHPLSGETKTSPFNNSFKHTQQNQKE